ncbi:MAG: hypothetical protein IT371_25290 [Deltaproteobacteria bacterium]|nr:hypothetical protein [Deltaproteobacteria bacterium]
MVLVTVCGALAASGCGSSSRTTPLSDGRSADASARDRGVADAPAKDRDSADTLARDRGSADARGKDRGTGDALVCTFETMGCKGSEDKRSWCCWSDKQPYPCCPGAIHGMVWYACNPTTGKCYSFCSDCTPPGFTVRWDGGPAFFDAQH